MISLANSMLALSSSRKSNCTRLTRCLTGTVLRTRDSLHRILLDWLPSLGTLCLKSPWLICRRSLFSSRFLVFSGRLTRLAAYLCPPVPLEGSDHSPQLRCCLFSFVSQFFCAIVWWSRNIVWHFLETCLPNELVV